MATSFPGIQVKFKACSMAEEKAKAIDLVHQSNNYIVIPWIHEIVVSKLLTETVR